MSVLDSLKFDADGYLEDPRVWTKEIGEAIAKREDVALTERSWVVIDYARKIFEQTGEAPTLRNITKNTSVATMYIYSSFPGGPGKMAATVAGLHKPTGCI
jgi:tRNA 2-thiouridine synthesizing protein E